MPATVGYIQDSITRKDRKRAKEIWESFQIGRQFRKSREKIWRRSERQYQGKTWTNRAEDPTSDLINVNISFSTINTIIPHLTGMEPEFVVAPFSADATAKNARIQEAFLNRMWRHKPVGAQEALKASTFDYLVYGDGYLKTTWTINERALSADETAEIADIYVDRLSPWDVWLDSTATGLDGSKWIAVRVWTTEEEARADETLTIPSSYQFQQLDPTSDKDDDGDKPYQATSGIGGNDRKWVELFELYDVFNKMMYVVPEDGDQPWKVVEGVEVPVEQIPGYTIPQSPYHMGELEQIFDIQMEIDKTRSQQIAHRKRNVSKVFVKEDALTPEAKSAMTSSVVGELVPIQGEGPLGELVAPLQLPPLPAESYQMARTAQDDIYEITGVTEYQRGSAPEITRTATEAQMMQGSANVKIDAKLNDVEMAVRSVGEYMLGIAKDVYPTTDVDEMAMFIGGADGQAINQLQAGEETQAALEQGDQVGAQAIADTAGLYGEAIITPTDEMFVGVYEVLVQHSSTDAVNPQVRAQKYGGITEKLMQWAPQLAQMGINVDISKMMRLWLEAENIPGVDAIMGGAAPLPVPPPEGGGQQQGGVPDEIAALMGGFQEGTPSSGGAPGPAPGQAPAGPPQAPISAANSGALDPASYPKVGV